MSLPTNELRAWILTRYSSQNNEYENGLKKGHLKALEDEDINGLEKLANILFVTTTLLFTVSREEFDRLMDIHKRLNCWLKAARSKIPRKGR